MVSAFTSARAFSDLAVGEALTSPLLASPLLALAALAAASRSALTSARLLVDLATGEALTSPLLVSPLLGPAALAAASRSALTSARVFSCAKTESAKAWVKTKMAASASFFMGLLLLAGMVKGGEWAAVQAPGQSANHKSARPEFTFQGRRAVRITASLCDFGDRYFLALAVCRTRTAASVFSTCLNGFRLM